MMCKIRVTKDILDLWPECRPENGKVYDANFVQGSGKAGDVAIIDFADKKIVLRRK
jgi:hypothetical protein